MCISHFVSYRYCGGGQLLQIRLPHQEHQLVTPDPCQLVPLILHHPPLLFGLAVQANSVSF